MLDPHGLSPIMNKMRFAAVALVALLAAWQVVRSAFVQAYAADNPSMAAALWPSHPKVLFKTALDEIAGAAAAGRPVPRSRINAIYATAGRAPLAPEPYLVRGVEAQLAGNSALAGRAFEAARYRDPRSLAAHYFLADHYLKTNQTNAGLVELARLTRFVPDGITSVARYYAAYAKAPGGAAPIKAMLRSNPQIEDPILAALAGDPANADLVLSLASGDAHSQTKPHLWHGRLVGSLVAAGNYAKARQVWSKLAGEPSPASGLFDPGFSGRIAPPPFNWTLQSNASGVAEAVGDGRLHLVYYGRDDTTLASQTLTLAPGRYRLSFKVQGSAKTLSSLSWKLACLPKGPQILSLGFVGSGGRASGDFSVGRDCGAQQLSLVGTSPDFPESVDAVLFDLQLSRVGS